MSIGGVDTVLNVPAELPAGKIIARVCLRHWPEGILEDDSDGNVYPLAEAETRLPARLEQEFFVYRDTNAAKDWESEGATSKNVIRCSILLSVNRTRGRLSAKSQ